MSERDKKSNSVMETPRGKGEFGRKPISMTLARRERGRRKRDLHTPRAPPPELLKQADGSDQRWSRDFVDCHHQPSRTDHREKPPLPFSLSLSPLSGVVGVEGGLLGTCF